MSDAIFKHEVKWIWVDEHGVQCSPMHDTLGRAVRFKGNWKPFAENPHRTDYRKNYGSKNPPKTLRKVVIEYRYDDDQQAEAITEAFATSDALEAGEENA